MLPKERRMQGVSMQSGFVPIQNSGLSETLTNWFIELFGLQHTAALTHKYTWSF